MKNWIRKLGDWTAGRVSVLILTVFLYPGDATASLDLAFRGTGLILGNSHEEGKTIHGLNLTIGVPEKLPFEKINGISLGLLGPYANEFNGIAAGLLYVHGYPEGIIRGLAFGGLAVDAEEIWGAAFSGGPMVYDRFRGIALGFLGMGGLARSSESIIGLAVNGIWIEADEFKGIGFALAHAIAKKEMTGLMIGVVRTDIGRVNGVAVGGGMMNAVSVRGLSIGGLNRSDELNGISIGLVNMTKNLRGLQVGFLNYAGNNPRLLRWLPFINAHF